jgi:L-threonylcarbamoyladenylate synthase
MLGEKAEIILDGGPSQVGVESTVLDICHGHPRILRPGGIPKEAFEALIGPVADGITGAAEVDTSGLSSPGMLKSHYAPHARLSVHAGRAICSLPAESGAAFLFFDGASRNAWLKGQPQPEPDIVIAVLSETGNSIEAAARFFRLLHELDRPGIIKIFAQLAPEENLGIAINDRLRRASHSD